MAGANRDRLDNLVVPRHRVHPKDNYTLHLVDSRGPCLCRTDFLPGGAGSETKGPAHALGGIREPSRQATYNSPASRLVNL